MSAWVLAAVGLILGGGGFTGLGALIKAAMSERRSERRSLMADVSTYYTRLLECYDGRLKAEEAHARCRRRLIELGEVEPT